MSKRKFEEICKRAGINFDGSNPDIKVNDERFYKEFLKGSLAIGEAYMAGWWDAEDLQKLIEKIYRADLARFFYENPTYILQSITSKIFNFQSLSRSFQVGEEHYDIGNELYEKMLDKRMTYTCGYWRSGAKDLDQAQVDKLDLVCRKLNLEPGMKVLDIGCGWGSFMKYAVDNYNVECVGLTVSKEQAKWGNEKFSEDPITYIVEDYRKHTGQYDRVLSIGMFEHVGPKNYREYFKACNRNLKPGGICFLHTIGKTENSSGTDPWINKYIFPNGVIPSVSQIGKAMEEHFIMEDWHNFGEDYALTLNCWKKNFKNHWEELKSLEPKKYDERFYRMWCFYLDSCAASFAVRNLSLWQIVMTKKSDKIPQPYCRYA